MKQNQLAPASPLELHTQLQAAPLAPGGLMPPPGGSSCPMAPLNMENISQGSWRHGMTLTLIEIGNLLSCTCSPPRRRDVEQLGHERYPPGV